MSAIHDLIAKIGDVRLRDRLAAEWANASQEKKFGLLFEDHRPELLPLQDAKPQPNERPVEVVSAAAQPVEFAVDELPTARCSVESS